MVSSRGMNCRKLEEAAQALKRARMQIDATTFYLESVPKEVLDYVVKFLSRRPDADNWIFRIPLRDTVELLGLRGELGRVLKARLTTLCISRDIDCSYEHEQYGWKLWLEGMDWTDDIRFAHDFVTRESYEIALRKDVNASRSSPLSLRVYDEQGIPHIIALERPEKLFPLA